MADAAGALSVTSDELVSRAAARAPAPARGAGCDGVPGLLLGGDPPGVQGCRLLPNPRPAPLRRSRARCPDLLPRHIVDRARMPLHGLDARARFRPRAAGRLVLLRAGAGRTLRRRRLHRVRELRLPGRSRRTARRRLPRSRDLALLLRRAVRVPPPAARSNRPQRGQHRGRRAPRAVHDARQLGRSDRSQGKRLPQRRHRRRPGGGRSHDQPRRLACDRCAVDAGLPSAWQPAVRRLVHGVCARQSQLGAGR